MPQRYEADKRFDKLKKNALSRGREGFPTTVLTQGRRPPYGISGRVCLEDTDFFPPPFSRATRARCHFLCSPLDLFIKKTAAASQPKTAKPKTETAGVGKSINYGSTLSRLTDHGERSARASQPKSRLSLCTADTNLVSTAEPLGTWAANVGNLAAPKPSAYRALSSQINNT